jgi:hypothetical protein
MGHPGLVVHVGPVVSLDLLDRHYPGKWVDHREPLTGADLTGARTPRVEEVGVELTVALLTPSTIGARSGTMIDRHQHTFSRGDRHV